MRRLASFMIALFLVASVSPAFAATIQHRQKKQQHRIQRGVKHGKLTPKETSRLQNQQNLIKVEKSQAMMDGKMTRRERQDIHHDQNRLSKDIHHKKYNNKKVHY